jgi:hypothetical protein
MFDKYWCIIIFLRICSCFRISVQKWESCYPFPIKVIWQNFGLWGVFFQMYLGLFPSTSSRKFLTFISVIWNEPSLSIFQFLESSNKVHTSARLHICSKPSSLSTAVPTNCWSRVWTIQRCTHLVARSLQHGGHLLCSLGELQSLEISPFLHFSACYRS